MIDPRLATVLRGRRGGVAFAVVQKLLSAGLISGFLILYARLLTPLDYAVWSLYVSLQLILTVFDLGISSAASREFAGRIGAPEWSQRLRTFEVWMAVASGLLLAFGLVVLFPGLSRSGAGTAAVLAVVLLTLELPAKLYLGVLIATSRQGSGAAFLLALDVVRYGGGYVLLLLHPDVTWLLCWVGASIVVFLAAIAGHTWRHACPGARPRVTTTIPALRAVLVAVIAPMAFATVAGAVRLYSDRIYGLRGLPLAEAGVYATAFAFAGGVGLLGSQVSAALVPALFESAAGGRDAVIRVFLRSYALVVTATVLLGAALILAGPFLAVLMDFDAARATMLRQVLPIAVAAISVASIAGPAYAWALAERRYTLSSVANVGGAALVVLYLVLARPESGTDVAIAAVISSASYAVAHGVALTRPLGGPLSAVEGFLYQIPTWLGLTMLGTLTWLSV